MITPVAALWWFRPLSSAARVDEQSAVVELVVAKSALREPIHRRRRNRPAEHGRRPETRHR
jgi:hypothetical protein